MATQLPDQDLLVTEGSTAVVDVDLTTVNDTVPDCSACTAAYVASRLSTGTVHIRKDLSSGLSWVSASRLRVSLTADDLAGLGGMNLLHELVVYDALGNPSHAMRGALIVRQSFA